MEQELLKIKKKYNVKYVLTANLFEVYLFFILLMAVCVYTKNYKALALFTVIFIFIVLFVMIWQKKSAEKTYMCFYETKIVFKRKFLFIDKEKTINYEDVKDIIFAQGPNFIPRTFQKAFHMGNIYVYPKKGNIMMNGMQIENVANIEKVVEQIKQVAADKIK